MHVIQVLFPTRDNEGRPFPDDVLRNLRQILLDHFGGVTAYSRSPADGVWVAHGNEIEEPIVVVEVMADVIDEPWWRSFRICLERELRQHEIVIRSSEARKL